MLLLLLLLMLLLLLFQLCNEWLSNWAKLFMILQLDNSLVSNSVNKESNVASAGLYSGI
jgi:uncharacterized membrane protein YfhO